MDMDKQGYTTRTAYFDHSLVTDEYLSLKGQ